MCPDGLPVGQLKYSVDIPLLPLSYFFSSVLLQNKARAMSKRKPTKQTKNTNPPKNLRQYLLFSNSQLKSKLVRCRNLSKSLSQCQFSSLCYTYSLLTQFSPSDHQKCHHTKEFKINMLIQMVLDTLRFGVKVTI